MANDAHCATQSQFKRVEAKGLADNKRDNFSFDLLALAQGAGACDDVSNREARTISLSFRWMIWPLA